jgi:hypothetical protein
MDTSCAGVAGYPNMYKYYGGAMDGRTCALGSCTCSPTNASCTLPGAQWFQSSSTCTSGGVSIPSSGCSMAATSSYVNWVTTGDAALSGTCNPSGSGASTGLVTGDPATAVTVCCSN